jgi:hypothetical protein
LQRQFAAACGRPRRSSKAATWLGPLHSVPRINPANGHDCINERATAGPRRESASGLRPCLRMGRRCPRWQRVAGTIRRLRHRSRRAYGSREIDGAGGYARGLIGLTLAGPGRIARAHCRERGRTFGVRARLPPLGAGLPVQQATDPWHRIKGIAHDQARRK